MESVLAIAVREAEFSTFPDRLEGLAPYERAHFLVRLHGRPIGRVTVDVTGGAVTRSALEATFDNSMRWACHLARLHEAIGWDPQEHSPGPMPTATVAICTRDRPDDLDRCLRGVQALHPDGQDVLVVDNCPSDDRSEQVVRTFPGVRYVREPKPGLNNARNRALTEATGEIVAFIDDDATPDPGWLRALLRNYDRPVVMSVTGLTMPLVMDEPAQELFESYSTFTRGFHRRVFDPFQGDPLFVGDIGSGANMSMRRSLAQEVGLFDPALDAGTPTQSGGDHEMFTRILTRGFHIVYEPEAVNWHRHRRTYAELRKTVYGYGVGVYSALTRALVHDGEWGVFRVAFAWLRHAQIPGLWRALRRKPGAQPLDLILAELEGCLKGPWSYWTSSRRAKAMSR